MTPERWKRVNEVFQSALEREGAEREAFLFESCAGDSSLQGEVLSLLAAHDRAGVFIDAPPVRLEPAQASAECVPPALAPGCRLGAYEVVALVGAGGMGEVYRARDTRLGRDVAVKVLPRDMSQDPDRLRRLEQEARAAGVLDHPNVLAIHDVGSHEGAPYVVSELLEGETLRERLRGTALAVRKAVDYGVQIAQGLAAAHDKGIVHRDLKPENLFVTRDGRVKILDFGLAKLVAPAILGERVPGTESVTREATQPGTVLGTVGYMSPEQVRGERASPQSDIFSFGAILYEMLTGRRAFERDTAVETMSAILKHEPPVLAETAHNAPPVLERIVRRCLEKKPGERFHSARDLAFALETLGPPAASTPAAVAPFTAGRRMRMLAGILIPLALAIGSFFLGVRTGAKPIPSFRQLTFRRGTVESARFSPDGNSVFYGAAWEGRPAEVFTMRLDGVEARALGLPRARLLATAPGEMAVVLRDGQAAGTLARLPLEGGSPREVLEDVKEADWTPDGARFAVVRGITGRTRLEFPIGKVLYETVGNLESPRVSPKGDRVAFIDQPMLGNTPGSVVVVDLEGGKQALSEGWGDAGGLAWSPGGDEVWFTATRAGTSRSLHAVSLSGTYRLVTRTPGAMILQDISRDGRVLLTHAQQRSEALARLAGEVGERDLSWFDWTHATDFVAHEGRLLFTAEGEGGGPLYTIYLRRAVDGSPVRLGEGHSTELSPDGAWALAMVRTAPPQLLLLPTGPGEPRTLPREEGIVEHHWAWWFPDGKHILFLGNKAGRPAQLFVQDVPDGTPRALAAVGVTAYRNRPISPDGRLVVALVPGEPGPRFVLYPVDGGEPRPLPGLDARDQPIRWSADGRSLFVRARGAGLPVHIDRLDLPTGRRFPWKQLSPADPAGVESIGDILLDSGGESPILSCRRLLTELYLVDGLK